MSCSGCNKHVNGVSRAAGNTVRGIVGLTMSVLGPQASTEVVEERTVTCDGCEHKTRVLGKAFCGHPVWGDAEGGCGCWLPAKRRNAKKSCEKWVR